MDLVDPSNKSPCGSNFFMEGVPMEAVVDSENCTFLSTAPYNLSTSTLSRQAWPLPRLEKPSTILKGKAEDDSQELCFAAELCSCSPSMATQLNSSVLPRLIQRVPY